MPKTLEVRPTRRWLLVLLAVTTVALTFNALWVIGQRAMDRQFWVDGVRKLDQAGRASVNASSDDCAQKPIFVTVRPPICEYLCPCQFTSNGTTFQSKCFGASDTQWSHAKSIPHYPAHLCPQNYRNLADWVYKWYGQYHDENLLEVGVGDAAPCLPEGSIIFVRGWNVDEFFRDVYPQLQHSFVLITAETDLSVPSPEHMHFVTEPSKVIHWFAQDALPVPAQARFTPIPIGLNCRDQSYKITQVMDKYRQLFRQESSSKKASKVLQSTSDIDPFRLFAQPEPSKLLLINFDPSSDPTGYRYQLWNQACNANAPDNWLGFTDCITKEHGVRQYVNDFEKVYERNMQYKFWLSPRGNGVDCHRTWEAFYLGRIPVVRKSELDEMMSGLPVLVVDDLLTITRPFLEDQWKIMQEKYRRGEYSFGKLKRSYWDDLILSKSRHRGIAADDPHVKRIGRCWWPQ